MWNNTCFLGSINKNISSIGDLVENIVYDNEIFCNEKSIKASEFYQAHAVGMKPEITLEVMSVDYNKETYVKYEDDEYTVLRTYKTSTEKIELTLVKGVNNGSS